MGGTVVSGAAGLAALALAGADAVRTGWALLGWGSLAAVGLGAGAWLAARHATAGAGFVVALVAGMLARLVAAGAGTAAAAATGGRALAAYLVGLVLGFAPLQVFEMVFFYREARSDLRSGLQGSGGGRLP